MGTEIGSNQCENRKMEESGWVPGKRWIRASIEKLFGWVSEKGHINVCTEKWNNPDEYQKKVESVQVSKNCSNEYQKGPISVSTENGRIRASTAKR